MLQLFLECFKNALLWMRLLPQAPWKKGQDKNRITAAVVVTIMMMIMKPHSSKGAAAHKQLYYFVF